MYQRVKAYVEKYHMLQENDHVITGVSGGADSVCLLFMLKEFKNEMPLELTVVHIHHGIRGDSADNSGSGIWHFMRMWSSMQKNRA